MSGGRPRGRAALLGATALCYGTYGTLPSALVFGRPAQSSPRTIAPSQGKVLTMKSNNMQALDNEY